MDKDTRATIERATQQARRLLEDDFTSQLESTFDVLRTGHIAPRPGKHLKPRDVIRRNKIVAAIDRKRAAGMSSADAVIDYRREAAFTTLNRFVALKMLEARELVQECITKRDQSTGYREFCGLAPGVELLPDRDGYRLYLESLFDELSTAVKVLFDRRDLASVLWPKRATMDTLFDILNASDLSTVWGEDETIGWVYQFFNSGDERRKMREESQAPRNSRELAVRNQFFTPRYVVEFLVDNTLGRTWLEMYGDHSRLAQQCKYFVRTEDESKRTRSKRDPRDLRILDPACGSGHFLLYSFDLLLEIYQEAWYDAASAPGKATGKTLREDFPDLTDFQRAVPVLIVEQNLYGVDIDPRPAQIAAFALWLRAQRAFKDWRISANERPSLRRTHIIVAEPMPGDKERTEQFASQLDPPLLRDLFHKMVHEMRLAGELGSLIRVDSALSADLDSARKEFEQSHMAWQATLAGFEPARQTGDFNLAGIEDDQFFHEAEDRILTALRKFSESSAGEEGLRRKLFEDDATHGIALIELLRLRFDVVLMNPPFGAASLAAKKVFESSYPRTKNDVYAAFVERGVKLLRPRGFLGAITSRSGFFVARFQRWREEIILKEAPPVVFADLGYGVMDAAMVEAAAYCLEKRTENPA